MRPCGQSGFWKKIYCEPIAPGAKETFGDCPIARFGLEQRLADVIAAYDAQGNHRTGTPVDDASGEWLARQLQEIGAKAELEPLPLSRVDPKSYYLRIADRRIEGVPLFDAAFTEGYGVRGKLGPLGSDAEIGLAEPFSLLEPRRAQAGVVAEVRRSLHKAVVLLTAGTRPGLFLLNAVSFRKPSGPPTLQVSSVESEWLKHQAQEHAEARSLRTSAGRLHRPTMSPPRSLAAIRHWHRWC